MAEVVVDEGGEETREPFFIKAMALSLLNINNTVKPKEFAKLALYYSQEIALDAATPGKEAKDRTVRNARLLHDAVETMVIEWGWEPRQLMKEVKG